MFEVLGIVKSYSLLTRIVTPLAFDRVPLLTFRSSLILLVLHLLVLSVFDELILAKNFVAVAADNILPWKI